MEKLYLNREKMIEECEYGILKNTFLPVKELCIALTNKCNLYCIMCPFCNKEYENKTYNNEVPFVTSLMEYKKIINEESVFELQYKSDFSSNLSSGLKIHFTHGESFLNPEIAEILEYTKQMFPNVFIRISSNGTISPSSLKTSDNILKNIDQLCFSIDAFKKDTFELIRQPANYEHVMRNLKEWSKLNEENNFNTIFRFTVALSLLNIEEIIDLILLCEQLKVKRIFLQPLIVDDDHKKLEKYKLENADKSYLQDRVSEISDQAKKCDIVLEIHPAIISLINEEQISTPGCDASCSSIYCSYLKNGLLEIDNHGEIKELCCNMSPLTNRKLIKKYNININSSPFEIYNSKGFWQLRKDMVEGKLIECCKNCNNGVVDYNKLSKNDYKSSYLSDCELREIIINLKVLLKSKEDEVKLLKSRNNKYNSMIKQRNNWIESYKNQIEELKLKNANRDEMIANRNEMIKNRENWLEQQISKNEKKDKMITNRDQIISTIKADLIKQNEIILAKDVTINNLKKEVYKQKVIINKMLSSFSWKITQPLRYFKKNEYEKGEDI